MESTHPTAQRHSSSYQTKRDIIDGWRYNKDKKEEYHQAKILSAKMA
jgi:hypothetical protein